MYLSEQLKIIPLGYTADYNGGFTAESINTKNMHHVMFLLSFGAVTGATPAALTVKSGASDGVQTTAETFSARYGSAAQAAATADVFTAWTSQTTLSVASATITTRCMIVEVDVDTLTAGQPWLTLALSADGDTGILHGFAVCVPRYEGNAIPTAI